MSRPFESIVETRLSRRSVLSGIGLGVGATVMLSSCSYGMALAGKTRSPAFDFEPLPHGIDENHHVADGYTVDVLLRWGDPIQPGAPAFEPMNQSAEAQRMQFGYNNDFVGLVPMGPDRMMMGVNHEYATPTMMFPDLFDASGRFDRSRYTRRHAEIERAAVGVSMVELRRDGERWAPVVGPLNRKIDGLHARIAISGPAAGHPRMRTVADPTGRTAIGTFANCAGGVTPWGSYLTAEENIDDAFAGALSADHPEAENHRRMGVMPRDGRETRAGEEKFGWGLFDARFDIGRDPNEPNHFGWIVEIDALDRAATPKKRTALGRFAHEGAETIVNRDGRLVVYMGDDARHEFLYRFVSRDRVHPDRAANADLLDHGVLSVAMFDEDGMRWAPLVFGHGPLTADNGFNSQADVVIETRRAATLLGATPMDRPEDVEAHPTNGRVYVMLTNNSDRTETNVVNPRVRNRDGQILELVAPDGDHSAERFDWEILVLCGDPADPHTQASWNAASGPHDWFSSPDNCAFDPEGRLWVATDQGSNWARNGHADGLWAMETEGERRGLAKRFFRVPAGAEMAGPRFTRDGRHLFLSVQHPATDDMEQWAPWGRRSTAADPAHRWPDFQPGMPPRPAVVVVRRDGGGVIGGAPR